jgi:hypothetical protein
MNLKSEQPVCQMPIIDKTLSGWFRQVDGFGTMGKLATVRLTVG